MWRLKELETEAFATPAKSVQLSLIIVAEDTRHRHTYGSKRLEYRRLRDVPGVYEMINAVVTEQPHNLTHIREIVMGICHDTKFH
tara:strand:+ start:23 stop:277 length:255 start_codon:yes stop_codon:yes gene_type:complete